MATKSERMIRLINLISDSRAPLELNRFSRNTEEWGDARTFRRLRDELNGFWQNYAGEPLFVYLDENHQITSDPNSRKFMKLNQNQVKTRHLAGFASIMAFRRFVKSLGRTIIESEYDLHFKSWLQSLSRTDKAGLETMGKKFYFVQKGMSSYGDQPGILDDLYDALIRQKFVDLEFTSEGRDFKFRIKPLSLLMFNTGLYLAYEAVERENSAGVRFYKVKVDHVTSVVVTKETFPYPEDYDPGDLFSGEFGFISGDFDPVKVVLDIPAGSWAVNYLRGRSWTGGESYQELENPRRIRMEMMVSSFRELVPWILGFGDQMVVVEPSELVAEVREKAGSVVRLYDDSA